MHSFSGDSMLSCAAFPDLVSAGKKLARIQESQVALENQNVAMQDPTQPLSGTTTAMRYLEADMFEKRLLTPWASRLSSAARRGTLDSIGRNT